MKFAIKTIIVVLILNVLIQLAPEKFVHAENDNNKITDQYLEKLNADKTKNEKKSENPAVSNDESQNTVGLTAFDYIKSFFFLVVVLAILIYVLKFINKKTIHYQQNSIVQNLGGTSLGAQKSVQLLRIGESIYIVGIGDNVQLIKEITDPNEIEEIINQYNERLTVATSAPKLLNFTKKIFKNKNHDVPSNSEDNSDFGNILRKNISDITKERRNELEKWKEKEHDK